MLDFTKICNQVEKMNPLDRTALIIEESAKIVKKFSALSITAYKPMEILATFIMGAVMSDGVINEKEYLLIYPSLVKAFGEDFDYETVKKHLCNDKEGQKLLTEYVNALMKIISVSDEDLQTDIVTLCLLIVAIDGKVSLKERRYIRQLCK